MNISEHFFKAANDFPDKLALVDRKEKITFGELKTEVEETANYFKSATIKKGDRVLVFVPMSISLYRIVLALFSIGAVPVFLDEWVGKKRLQACCREANCTAFIAPQKIRLLGFLIREIRTIPIKLNAQKKRKGTFQLISVKSEDAALITFTTGSSGIPKAAVRSHGFLNEQFRVINKEVNPSHDDIEAVSLPIMLFMNLAFGCTSVIARLKNKKNSNKHWETIYSYYTITNVNRLTCSPSEIEALSVYLIENKAKINSITSIYTGGGPVFPNQAATIQKAFPQAEVCIVYGATEAEPISTILAKELIEDQKLKSKGLKVGKIHENISLRILALDQKSSEITLEIFEESIINNRAIGEIIVSGSHVLNSYLNQETLSQNKLKVGNKLWHRTGDSGFVENETLHLTGRVAQLIFRENKLLSPFVIENALQYYSEIKTGTLINKNDMLYLCLELKKGHKYVENLSFEFDYDEIRIFKHIPKDPRHRTKIDYQKLIEMI